MSSILEGYHDFFVAMAGVLGALIGLLFVAITVSQDRTSAATIGHRQRLRSAAAFTAFSNVLTTCLFGLVPGVGFGGTVVAIGCAGLVLVAATALKLRSYDLSWALLRDALYLIALGTVLGFEVAAGHRLQQGPSGADALPQLATLLVVCTLVGIARAWDLVEAPGVRLPAEAAALAREVVDKVRERRRSSTGAE